MIFCLFVLFVFWVFFGKLNFSTADKPVQPDIVSMWKTFVALECPPGWLRESDNFSAVSWVDNTRTVQCINEFEIRALSLQLFGKHLTSCKGLLLNNFVKNSIPQDAEHWPWSSRAIVHVQAVSKTTGNIFCIFCLIHVFRLLVEIRLCLCTQQRTYKDALPLFSVHTSLTFLSVFLLMNSNRVTYKILCSSAVI